MRMLLLLSLYFQKAAPDSFSTHRLLFSPNDVSLVLTVLCLFLEL